MGTCPPMAVLERKRKALEKKHGEPFRILRASNGEASIVSVRYIESCYAPKSQAKDDTCALCDAGERHEH